jgi:RecJ-like exonuclease
MLQDNQRHDEKLPLVLLLGVGATAESLDGLGLLDVYGAERVVVDAAVADEEVEALADAVVNPGLAGADAVDLSTGALGANLAAAVDAGVRDDIAHLPAVSYWEGTPEAYTTLAADAGYDADRTRELREAIALEAYYQSYEDKRELITDLLFDDGVSPGAQRAGGDAVEGNLAGHIAEQFRIKLDTEVETAQANLDVREEGDVTVAVLDADAYTHRYDFPPTSLLVDELHRRNREGDEYVTVATATDELFVRATGDVDIRAVAAAARDAVPEGGVTAVAVRDNRIEFLSGARDAVVDAVVEATVEQF